MIRIHIYIYIYSYYCIYIYTSLSLSIYIYIYNTVVTFYVVWSPVGTRGLPEHWFSTAGPRDLQTRKAELGTLVSGTGFDGYLA